MAKKLTKADQKMLAAALIRELEQAPLCSCCQRPMREHQRVIESIAPSKNPMGGIVTLKSICAECNSKSA